MSHSPSSRSLSTLTITELQNLAKNLDDPLDHDPKKWFEQARYAADKAVLAERGKKKEEMLVEYIRACQCYQYTKGHPSYAEFKKKDLQWANRVRDFREVYESFLEKAKEVKTALRSRDVEHGSSAEHSANGSSSSHDHSRPNMPSRQSTNGPDTKAGGSIADRMKALQGRGMEVGASSSKHASSHAPDTGSSSDAKGKGTMGGASVSGGAGSFGPTRRVGQVEGPRPRKDSSATSTEHPQAKPKPVVPPKPHFDKPTSHHPISPQTSGSPSITNNHVELPTSPPSNSAPSSGKTRAAQSATSPPPPHRTMSPSTPQKQLHPSHSGPSPSKPIPEPRPPTPISPVRPALSRHASRLSGTTTPKIGSPLASPSRLAKNDDDDLGDFEKAFPSLTEFGKQFEDEEEDSAPKINSIFERDPDARSPPRSNSMLSPNQKPNGPRDLKKVTSRSSTAEDKAEIAFPDVPSFPDIPSAPTHKPSHRPDDLPPPPPKPKELQSPKITTNGLRPPSPETGESIKRPASTPNVATLLEQDDAMLPTAPTEVLKAPPPPIPPSLRENRSPLFSVGEDGLFRQESRGRVQEQPNGGQGPSSSGSRSGSKNPPVPPPQEPIKQQFTKPKFPLSNSIDPNTIRTYLLNPAVDILLLDVRPEDEYKTGHVGQEYEARGAKVRVVWMDPTVLQRDGMTSNKLEDSLSLGPEDQRKAFEDRSSFDVVIAYDQSSKQWPRKEPGKPSAPLAKLWDIIYEHEFSKKLQRNPVLLNGGYDTWVEFIKKRGAMHAENHARALARARANGHKSPEKANGYPSERPSSRPPSQDMAAKRANRDMPVYQSSIYAKNITDSFGYGPQSMTGESSYNLQSTSRPYVTSPSNMHRPTHSPSQSISNYSSATPAIAPPPQASIRPGPGGRRRSDYVEQHNQVYSGFTSPTPPRKQSIDYPTPHGLTKVPQPPPPAQSHSFERYDTRPAVVRSGSIRGLDLVAREGDEVRYWNDVVLGLTGLKNLGNTCYMNSTIQCLSATFPFTSYFLDGSYKRSINVHNPMGMKGALANAFAELLKALWKEDYTFLSPVTFRKNIISFSHNFSGTEQHDSQEFLSFVLDGLHEDLNRIQHKPAPIEMTPEREASLETLPTEIASEKEWQIYRRRDDSFIVDLFQGQYRNRLECLTCHKTSTTYDTFMYLSLPVPTRRNKIVLQELIDEFVSAEILEGEDAWNCPRCKVPRKASKTLTLSRLPPVLLIQLKRFYTTDGLFWNKSETPVVFPTRGLDLTRYMPYRQPHGKEDLEDPRTQLAPFKYDLYGVSNHHGTLSSGHYTAFVKSSKGWQYCEDSRITKSREEDVVTRPAYMLFYKRIKA